MSENYNDIDIRQQMIKNTLMNKFFFNLKGEQNNHFIIINKHN